MLYWTPNRNEEVAKPELLKDVILFDQKRNITVIINGVTGHCKLDYIIKDNALGLMFFITDSLVFVMKYTGRRALNVQGKYVSVSLDDNQDFLLLYYHMQGVDILTEKGDLVFTRIAGFLHINDAK